MRIRTIKPDFWEDELIASWPPMTRLAYIAMWNEADDAGRMRATASYLRSKLFPYDHHLKMDEVLKPIIKAGKLVLYAVNGQQYGFIPKFSEYQVINRPTLSRLPECPLDVLTESSLNPHGVLSESSLEEGEGERKEKGKDICSEVALRASLPDDPIVFEFPVHGHKTIKLWPLTTSKLREYQESFPSLDVKAVCRTALQWCRDNPTKRKTGPYMAAFLTRWLSSDQNKAAQGSRSVGSATRSLKPKLISVNDEPSAESVTS